MYLYGYRMNECDKIDINPISTIRFLRAAPYGPQRSERLLLSTSLPLYIPISPPRPDPGHTPSYMGGAMKRMGYEPPPMNRTYKRGFKRFVTLWVRRNLVPLTDLEVPTVPEWLDCTDYSEARKSELLKVWKSHSKLPRRKTLRKVKSFIKDETYPTMKYPRLINSRVDIAKCLFGPLCHAVSKRLFALPQFIKTVPVSDRPRVIRDTIFKEGEEAHSTDYTSFEAHFVKERMKLTTKILFDHMTSKCGSYIRGVSDLMFETLSGQNHIVNKLVSFLISAKRCSGEMDTSLSNGFTNAMNIEYLAFLNGCSVVYFVEGDDGIARFSPSSRAPTNEQYVQLGYNIKIIKNTDLAELSFCGQVYDMDDLTVVTDIKEQLARFGFTNKKYVGSSRKTLMQLLRAKGFSLLYQYNGCPILAHLGSRILYLTRQTTIEQRILDGMDLYHKKRFLESYQSGNLPTLKIPGTATRLLVERLYNITINDQILLEEEISRWELGAQEPALVWPDDWVSYYQQYNTSYKDRDPSWLLRDESTFANYIKTFANASSVVRYS